MKLLDNPRLHALTGYLTDKSLGDRVVDGRVEAFSCKRAGEDKKLSKQLERQYADELSTSPSSFDRSSSLGSLNASGTRRLLIDLISTLNASFPDHDFSALRAEHFEREADASSVMRNCNTQLGDLSESSDFLEELWAAIDDAIKVRECEVYTYVPDLDTDPLSEGCIWSFNYFFFNKQLKRIVYLSCVAKPSYSRFPASPGAQGYSQEIEDEWRIDRDGESRYESPSPFGDPDLLED
mmetsp:Transcript_25022/g.75122  ORF Transcript_25022/g.75122 Transcript_25022/m.75122 type:complete len:238 (+) Transcript_25022:197-910(+)|eukprot:CAMPEP_0119275666 /NCGR_PEP_ID=MMETSP1329-20130426/14169_1 /TAXON_ID=114041 /ORGANISM="Genus nov. species nov., Strain RCC1024" /LENGTH=237 /DNA_ID=CAMNT_0007276065 /DNA_START=137 /DNA_END=850 /DNA_ORIENTATION=-